MIVETHDCFRERLACAARCKGPIILAADLPGGPHAIQDMRTILDAVGDHICAVKLNMQMLLPLGIQDILHITQHAGSLGLQCIADIKLNDIGNTNMAASDILWEMGFDALIANPIMGPAALAMLTAEAHRTGHGTISICHMSSPEGSVPYEMHLGPRPLYETFLDWGLSAGVDGVVIGATFPSIIESCRRLMGDAADIVSPGVGAQGGSGRGAINSGSDYIIVGRSIFNSDDPTGAARSLL